MQRHIDDDQDSKNKSQHRKRGVSIPTQLRKIDEANGLLKGGVDGLNENIWTKIDQLEFHEQVNKLYKQGMIQKDMFSHYLSVTEKHRKQWLSQLKYIIEFEENRVSTEKLYIDIKWNK